MQQNAKEILQWHPAFYSGLKIDLADEVDKLIFENEHALSNKPMLIDVLIIKKNTKEPIRKNIGAIFRGYNIIEYKSPEDYLSIDDFYKVHGYAYFYKSDSMKVNAIPIEEVTITFVSHGYPREMLQHLICVHGYKVEQQEDGIYYIIGDILPIQLIVCSKLSKKNNYWLKNLTNKLKANEIPLLIEEYKKHKDNKLYDAVMDVIIRANIDKWEVKPMCKALEELMKDTIAEKEQLAEQKGWQQGMQQGMQQGVQQGMQQAFIKLIKRRIEQNKTLEQIAEDLDESIEIILPLYNQIREEL